MEVDRRQKLWIDTRSGLTGGLRFQLQHEDLKHQ
jgi:hypothetical protein